LFSPETNAANFLTYQLIFHNTHYYLIVYAFQSLEVSVSEYEVERVVHRIREKNTLVVGPVLDGHEFIAGTAFFLLVLYILSLCDVYI